MGKSFCNSKRRADIPNGLSPQLLPIINRNQGRLFEAAQLLSNEILLSVTI